MHLSKNREDLHPKHSNFHGEMVPTIKFWHFCSEAHLFFVMFHHTSSFRTAAIDPPSTPGKIHPHASMDLMIWSFSVYGIIFYMYIYEICGEITLKCLYDL